MDGKHGEEQLLKQRNRYFNISVYQKMPQISLYDVNFDDFLTAGVRKQNHINRTAAHELLTHGGRISHIFSADSPELQIFTSHNG